jgi:8-oxo-dGTP diphosphatase
MMKKFHVGVKGVVKVGDACLILKKDTKDGRGFWDVPGGRIDDAEQIFETLARELREEVPSMGAYTVGSILGALRLPIDVIPETGLVLIFYEVEAEAFEVVLSEEHSAYRWITRETLKELQTDGPTIKPELYAILEKMLMG